MNSWRLAVATAIVAAVLAGCSADPKPEAKPEPVQLLLGASGGKSGWLRSCLRRFEDSRPHLADGRPVEVKLVAHSSEALIANVVSGQLDAHAVVPSSSRILDWLPPEERVYFGEPFPLVITPVVFAAVFDVARSLGWPDTPFGWRELAAMGSNPDLWEGQASLGVRELRFVMPDPERTVTGRLALHSMIQSATLQNRAATPVAVSRPQTRAFLAACAGTVGALTSAPSRSFEDLMRAGRFAATVMLSTEQLVFRSYGQNPREPIVAMYPRDAPFVLDHPLISVEAPWVTPAHREALVLLREFLLAPEQQSLASSVGFRLPTAPPDRIAPLDPARGIDPCPLPPSFPSMPPGVRDLAMEIWRETRPPADVLLVMDYSGSMSAEGGQRAGLALRMAGRILDDLGPRDTAGLLLFNERKVLAVRPALRNEARQRIVDVLGRTLPNGGSALYETVREIVDDRLAPQRSGRMSAVVLCSDGLDTHSPLLLDPLSKRLTLAVDERDASPIYAMGFGGDLEMDVLARIAHAAHGRVYELDDERFDAILHDLTAYF